MGLDILVFRILIVTLTQSRSQFSLGRYYIYFSLISLARGLLDQYFEPKAHFLGLYFLNSVLQKEKSGKKKRKINFFCKANEGYLKIVLKIQKSLKKKL